MKSIEPYKTVLSDNNAYWMARISKAVYLKESGSDKPDKSKILDDLKMEDPRIISVKGESNNSAQGAVIEHEDYICIAFCGTDQINDWLDNINAFQERALFGGFHRGFWKSLNDVWTPLYEQYSKLRSKKKRPLFLTGHSLGGAMATVAAAKLIHEDRPFTSVYTFGQPRAVSLETARIFNVEAAGRYFRFQNNNDMVTRVPGRLMGYSHIGSCLYISREKKIHKDPGFWFRFLDSVDGAVDAVRETGIDAVEDHSMDDYLGAIAEWKMEE